MSVSVFLSIPEVAALVLLALGIPIGCLLLYRFSRRQVWLWLGGLSGVILLLEVSFVILFIKMPLWFINLLSSLTRD